MKKSTQYLTVSIVCALSAALFVWVAVFIQESGRFSNGYDTFNITGAEDTFAVLFILGATIASIVYAITKTVSFTNKRVTN